MKYYLCEVINLKVKRIILLILFIVSVSYFLLYSTGTGYPYYMPMMYHAYPSNLGYVDLIFLWVGLSSFVLLVIDFVPKAGSRNSKVLDILNNRLISGELDIVEYNKIKKEIS